MNQSVPDASRIQPLVIVRRDKFATFGLLAQVFASEPNVRLVWDRRIRERRLNDVSSDPTDRRRLDRRRAASTWGSNDYVLVNVVRSAAPDTAQIDAVSAPDEGQRAHDSEEIRHDIEAAVRSDLTVLISGGDGTSRKSLAHGIHRRSDRRDRSLLVVDRNAFDLSLPRIDLVHAAPTEWSSAGTVLIEEVADLSWDQQSQLVRVLEWGAAQGWNSRRDPSRDPRIISGTGHALLERVASRQFRADLFYRLNVIHIVLPSDWTPTPD